MFHCVCNTSNLLNIFPPCSAFYTLTLQMVLSIIDGSPAARAGIHEGDELVEINGKLFFHQFFLHDL